MNDFNRIAWVYDILAHWVFRGNILKSQVHFLPLIQPNQRVLIIGGGSGEVLEAIDSLKIPLTVDFIEPSFQMIERAKKSALKLSNLNLNFHQIRFQSFESSQEYDWICCFYFLDLFKTKTLNEHLSHINQLMNGDTHLMVADFQNQGGRFWQKSLSIIMHGFFNLTAGLESRRLKDINGLLLSKRFQKKQKATFFGQFIFSAVYQKEVCENGNHS